MYLPLPATKRALREAIEGIVKILVTVALLQSI
jgi:hypothetical protein